ncbi:RNA polymerase sigma factor (sigma-70 family) [Marmoricola sp. OAE513]|uniref:sigma-70 family RNA polymerase sigma factor n=1 Tax=Marmoricola sp. OAE513 TaxID=2817894 RepID=UPI001AE744D1
MNALSGPTDAELVARVLQADREAFASVYDRYGPKLYDFAYSMLRHREDAADAVADSFILFAERLGQLRDPDRLRPWLYAIVRSECLRKLKARKRVSYGDDEQLIQMADDGATPEQSAETAALQQLVWDAAAGLADRDRALLDLHLRQGLEGAELGEAMGVSAANAYVMLNRLRAQVDKSLGALLVARLGRHDCDELDALLVDWDGTFSPLIRKRVARHVENCSTCGERRKKIVSPWMLLAGVPVFVAPLSLRDRVLDDTQLVAYSGTPTATSRWRSRSAGAAAAAALVAAASVTAVVAWPEDDKASDASAQVTESPAPAPSASAPTLAPTTTAPTAPATAEPSASEEPTASAGTISVSTTSINLGTRGTRGIARLTNTGGSPVAFTVAPDSGWLSAVPGSGTLQPGASTTLSIRANRNRVEEGRSTGRVRIRWEDGSATVAVSLNEQNAPQVGAPTASQAPSCEQQTVQVRATVTDQSRLTSVRLTWSGPNGADTATMTRSGSRWVASMGPFTFGGPVTFRVVATDRFGNTTTGPASTIEATPCPG